MTATADMKEAVAAFFGRLQNSEKERLNEIDALAEGCHASLRLMIDEVAATLPPLPPIESESTDLVKARETTLLGSLLGGDALSALV